MRTEERSTGGSKAWSCCAVKGLVLSLQVFSEAWNLSQAKATELLVLLAIADDADPNYALAEPSVVAIAAKARCSRLTVARCITALVDRGEIDSWQFYDKDQGRMRNCYRFTLGQYATWRGIPPIQKRESSSVVRARLPQSIRFAVLERDRYRCARCRGTSQLEVDHIKPRAEGGNDEKDNLRTLCRVCHRLRHSNTPDPTFQLETSASQVSERNVTAFQAETWPREGTQARPDLKLDPAVPLEKARKSPPPTPPDEVWDALALLFGEPSTREEKSARGKNVRDLKEAGATADVIAQRAVRWPKLFPNATLTPFALVKHWTMLGPRNGQGPASKPCPVCGLGGGRHLIDCQHATLDTQQSGVL